MLARITGIQIRINSDKPHLPPVLVQFSRVWSRINAGQPHFFTRISAILLNLIQYQCGSAASWTVLVQVNHWLDSHYAAGQVGLDPYSGVGRGKLPRNSNRKMLHNFLNVQYQSQLREKKVQKIQRNCRTHNKTASTVASIVLVTWVRPVATLHKSLWQQSIWQVLYFFWQSLSVHDRAWPHILTKSSLYPFSVSSFSIWCIVMQTSS